MIHGNHWMLMRYQTYTYVLLIRETNVKKRSSNESSIVKALLVLILLLYIHLYSMILAAQRHVNTAVWNCYEMFELYSHKRRGVLLLWIILVCADRLLQERYATLLYMYNVIFTLLIRDPKLVWLGRLIMPVPIRGLHFKLRYTDESEKSNCNRIRYNFRQNSTHSIIRHV